MWPAPAPDPYLVAWADLRRRRTRFWIAFLTWFPVAGGLSVLAHWALGRVLPIEPEPLVGLPLVALTIWLAIHNVLFRCPRCGEQFNPGRNPQDPLMRRC